MIYVLGSINTDIVAEVSALPKKGETIIADNFFLNCGGKGANQAAAAGKMGGDTAMIGKVGGDSFGADAKRNLESFGVNVNHIKVAENVATGSAIITISGGDNRIIIAAGANGLIEKTDVDEGLQNAKSGDILLTQLEIPLNIVEYALKKAKEKGMTTVLNPAPAAALNPDVFKRVDIITPNETETETLVGINPSGLVEIALCVKKFYALGVKNVIITLGSRGAVVSVGQEITEILPRKVKVVDTTSAGDTFVGSVCVMLSRGKNLVSACRFASVASSITITRKGAAVSIPTFNEVEQVIKTENIAL